MIRILFKQFIIEADDETTAVIVTEAGEVRTLAGGVLTEQPLSLGVTYVDLFGTETSMVDLFKIVNYHGIDMVVPGWVKFIATDESGQTDGYSKEPQPSHFSEIWRVPIGVDSQSVRLSDRSVFWADSVECV